MFTDLLTLFKSKPALHHQRELTGKSQTCPTNIWLTLPVFEYFTCNKGKLQQTPQECETVSKLKSAGKIIFSGACLFLWICTCTVRLVTYLMAHILLTIHKYDHRLKWGLYTIKRKKTTQHVSVQVSNLSFILQAFQSRVIQARRLIFTISISVELMWLANSIASDIQKSTKSHKLKRLYREINPLVSRLINYGHLYC